MTCKEICYQQWVDMYNKKDKENEELGCEEYFKQWLESEVENAR